MRFSKARFGGEHDNANAHSKVRPPSTIFRQSGSPQDFADLRREVSADLGLAVRGVVNKIVIVLQTKREVLRKIDAGVAAPPAEQQRAFVEEAQRSRFRVR